MKLGKKTTASKVSFRKRGGAGRTSQFQPLREAIQDLKNDEEVIPVTLSEQGDGEESQEERDKEIRSMRAALKGHEPFGTVSIRQLNPDDNKGAYKVGVSLKVKNKTDKDEDE